MGAEQTTLLDSEGAHGDVGFDFLVSQMETVYHWDDDCKTVIYKILEDQAPFQEALNNLNKQPAKD